MGGSLSVSQHYRARAIWGILTPGLLTWIPSLPFCIRDFFFRLFFPLAHRTCEVVSGPDMGLRYRRWRWKWAWTWASRKGRRNDDSLPVRSFLTLVSAFLEKSAVAPESG